MTDIIPKPRHLAPEYGAQFQDQSIAEAYLMRPAYPAAVFDILLGLIQDESRIVLDLGCGTGDIARNLAPHVTSVHAVDQSAAMMAMGQWLPGGQHPALHWIQSAAETFTYPARYSLAVAAESLHWMDWYVVLPRIRQALSPQGRLAIVGRGFTSQPWWDEITPLINEYSTNRDYQRYDLLEELSKRNLFTVEGQTQTPPVPFSQSIDDYVESFHSRNGFSRERMGARAAEFDEKLREILLRYWQGEQWEFNLVGYVSWGLPAV
jgi:SAM-dependent methyltransferase